MTNPPPLMRPLDAGVLTLTERTIDAVRKAIRTGELVPGELYSVYRIAEDLGISRSPVRDALLRLAETGIVRFEKNKGFRIVIPGSRELAEMISVRIALEVPAAGRAAAHATKSNSARLLSEFRAMEKAAQKNDERSFMVHDQRLHAIILELSGNSYVHRIIDNLRDATHLVGASTFKQSRTLRDVYEEHRPIVESIVSGDRKLAERAMEQHLKETGMILLQDALEREGQDRSSEAIWAKFVE